MSIHFGLAYSFHTVYAPTKSKQVGANHATLPTTSKHNMLAMYSRLHRNSVQAARCQGLVRMHKIQLHATAGVGRATSHRLPLPFPFFHMPPCPPDLKSDSCCCRKDMALWYAPARSALACAFSFSFSSDRKTASLRSSRMAPLRSLFNCLFSRFCSARSLHNALTCSRGEQFCQG